MVIPVSLSRPMWCFWRWASTWRRCSPQTTNSSKITTFLTHAPINQERKSSNKLRDQKRTSSTMKRITLDICALETLWFVLRSIAKELMLKETMWCLSLKQELLRCWDMKYSTTLITWTMKLWSIRGNTHHTSVNSTIWSEVASWSTSCSARSVACMAHSLHTTTLRRFSALNISSLKIWKRECSDALISQMWSSNRAWA